MNRLEYFLKWLRHRVVFPLLAFLPMRTGYAVARRIGLHDAKHSIMRPAIAHGMLTIYPDLARDQAHLEELLEHYFQMMARDMLDCFRMPRFSKSNMNSVLRVHHADLLDDAKAAGKGVILIISHYSRFFMLGPGLKFAGHEFGMFTTMVDERHPHYDPIDRWYVATKLRNTQLFSRGTWITTGDDPRRVYRALDAGEIMLIALDGTETNSTSRLKYPFMGGILTLPEGILRIASKTQAKMVFVSTVEHGYEVDIYINELPNDPQEGLAKAIQLLERDIIKYPWQWWQWAALASLWQPPKG